MTRASGIPAPLAPFAMFGRDVAEVVREPLPMTGGTLGAIALSAAIVSFFVFGVNLELGLPEEEEFEIDFDPGEIARLGPKPEDLPEKIIIQETRVPDDVEPVEESVTKEEKPEEKPPEEKEKPEEKIKTKDKPDPKKDKKAPISDKNRESNTPYKQDLPTVDELPGDPFGSKDGWSDRMKDGDPWATAVMAELNKLKYPSYSAQSKGGTYSFQLKICKDGRVDQVMQKGSTGDPQLDKLMKAEIERVKIPKPPADVAKMMKNPCVTLKYQFQWTASGKIK